MATIAASVLPSAEDTSDVEVSLLRLYVLRVMYLILVVGLGAMIVPDILSHRLVDRGVIASLLGAVWLLAFILAQVFAEGTAMRDDLDGTV